MNRWQTTVKGRTFGECRKEVDREYEQFFGEKPSANLELNMYPDIQTEQAEGNRMTLMWTMDASVSWPEEQ